MENSTNEQNVLQENEDFANQEKLNQFLTQLKQEQNLPLGMAAGIISSVVGAILWALITVSTGYQIGYMAVAIGFIVGYAVKYAGKGIEPKFGYIGASLALFGCLFGNFLSYVGFATQQLGLGYADAFDTFGFGAIVDFMVEDFGLFDILFYGIAVYEGYKFSFREISEEEIAQQVS